MAKNPWMKRCAQGAVALALVAGLAPAAPAIASEGDAQASWSDALFRTSSAAYSPYSYTSSDASLLAESNLPSKFDLRDQNRVTSVKLQNPWGTCWGFSIIAASETSVLSAYAENGTEIDPLKLDLSERQLAYFAYTAIPESTSKSQAGEGYQIDPDVRAADPNAPFNAGGLLVYGTTVFASGTGPVVERGASIEDDGLVYKNDENAIVYNVIHDDGTITAETLYQGGSESDPLTEKGYLATHSDVKSMVPAYYAPSLPMAEGDETVKPATWSVDEKYRDVSSWELSESNILPDTRVFTEDGEWVGIDRNAINAWKGQLMDGKAVSIAFYADTSQPNQEGIAQYMNENTWAHFTYEPVGINHAVTVVGWDDDYAASNFGDGVHRPEGNGAWIVKNSWGAETGEFPNRSAWGVQDEDGESTGYFYISYYDRTISMAETFDFDLNPTDADEYEIDQYNYLIAGDTLENVYDAAAPEANVFTAESDQLVRNIACEITKPNTEVTYQLYLLGDDAASPTDGTLQLTRTETYEYGGYHRLLLDSADWIPMREGQRYSVVVTQRCKDDGKYYQSASMNEAKRTFTAEEREEFAAQLKKGYEAFMLAIYKQTLMINDPSLTEEEAEAIARESIKDPEIQAAIDEMVENAIVVQEKSGWVGIVNAGESWTGSTENGAITWTDWADVVADMKKEAASKAFDNFPIKSMSEIGDFASIDSLSSLDALIAQGQALLDSLVVSADGTDVAQGSKWATQAERDALASALDNARACLQLAGADWATVLASTTPAQGSVDDQVASMTSAVAVAKDGTKAAPSEPAADEGDQGDAGDNAAANGAASAFGQTGDMVPVAVVAAIAVLAALVLAVAIWKVRRRNQR